MKSDSLQVLVADANTIVELLIESNGEITPEIETTLTELEKNLTNKVDAYFVVIERLQFETKYFKAKASVFNNAAKTLSNTEERLKENIKRALRAMDKTEIVGNDYKFKISKTKPRLIIDPQILADKFKKQTIVIEPDKDKIRALLDAGILIKGAHYEESFALRKTINKGK